MPQPAEHLAQAQHNEDLFSHLNSSPRSFADWQVTALFYAALHYVEAYLATAGGPGGIHSENHGVRNGYMAREAFLRGLFPDYRELYDRSQDVRYRAIQLSSNVVDALFTDEFQRVRSQLRGRLGLSS